MTMAEGGQAISFMTPEETAWFTGTMAFPALLNPQMCITAGSPNVSVHCLIESS